MQTPSVVVNTPQPTPIQPTPGAPTTVNAESVEILPPAEPPSKGYKTSEFWRSLMITGFGLGLMFYGYKNNDSEAKITGAAMASLAEGYYGVSRGIAKKRS